MSDGGADTTSSLGRLSMGCKTSLPLVSKGLKADSQLLVQAPLNQLSSLSPLGSSELGLFGASYLASKSLT